MEFERFYPDFEKHLKCLLEEKNSTRVNGIQHFLDFIIEMQQEGDLDPEFDEYSEEDFGQLIDSHKNSLIHWFKEKSKDWIEIKSSNRWVIVSQKTEAEHQVETDIQLNESDLKLLEKNIALHTENDLDTLKELYTKIESVEEHSNSSIKQKAKCSHIIAEIGFKKIDRIENAKQWNVAGNDYKNLKGNEDIEKSYNCLIKSGKIYASNYHYDEAADSFHKAIELKEYEKLDKENKKRHQKLIVDCRLQYERAGKNSEAAQLFILENSNKYHDANYLKKLPLFLYKAIANYGESPERVLLSAIVIILLSTGIYTYCGINQGKTIVYDFWASLYFSFVTFTTLGYGDFSPTEGMVRIFATFQALSGLLLTSLFMVTLVRKYSR